MIYWQNHKWCVCKICLMKDIEVILKQRTIDFAKEKFNNLEYYSRNILVKEKIYISDYDIIYWTGMNMANHLHTLSKILCTQCWKFSNSKEIITMTCQCQFCRDCLTSNLQAATNGEMLQNIFERNYAEKYGCICKNIFDVTEAFKLLKIEAAPYKINAQQRMNQYVGLFCIICGLQVLEGGDEVMVNTNRTTDNFFRFKIRKPEAFVNWNNLEQSQVNNTNNRSMEQQTINNNNNNNNRVDNSEDIKEVSYCDHIMCANCVEKELQKDSFAQNGKKNNYKKFLCKICDVEHSIDKTEWNKIFKKTCCATCVIV